MKKIASRILILTVALGFASLAFAADDKDAKPVKVTGWVVDDHCGSKGANAEHAACATKCVKEKGAKWALYVPEDKTLWIISDQEAAAKYDAKEVKVMARMDKGKKMVEITDWTWQ
jgi:hypothetical protein